MQLTFPFMPSMSYEINDYIISSSNQMVYNAISKWDSSWGILPMPYSLIIQGDKSAGKSYIAKIWQHLSNAHFLSMDCLVEHTLDNYDCFIIDNIHNWHERILLHIINILHEQKKYLLMTTNLEGISKITLPDLTSRMKAILNLQIDSPDQELIHILIAKYFSQSSIVISNQVLNFLIPRLPRRFDLIWSILSQINQFTLANKQNITIHSIAPILKNVTQNNYS